MATSRRTEDFDYEYLLHERNVRGLKATNDDQIDPVKDARLEKIGKIVNAKGQEVYDAKPLGVAIFGLGRIGSIHLDNVLANPRVSLKYCVEDYAERTNYVSFVWHLKERGVKMVPVDETDKVLADPEVEAVLVCTPTQTHEKIVVAALNAGKAVFCEKPLAKGHDAIKRCYALAASKNLPILCCFNRRFDPGYSQLADRVRSGEVGQVHVLKTTSRDSPRPSIAYLSTSGGIYQDCAVHDIDLICWVAGEYPVTVSSQAHTFTDDIRAINDFDTLAITMKFPSGAIGVIDISRHAIYGYDIRLEAFGNKGMLTANEKRPTVVTSHADQGSQVAPICFSFASRFAEGYRKELDHFVDVVKQGKPMLVTASQTLAVDKIATAAEQSARTGTVIQLKWD